MEIIYAVLLCVISFSLSAQSTSYRTSGCFKEKTIPTCQDSIALYNDSIKLDSKNGYYYYKRAYYQYACRDADATIKSCDTSILHDATQAVSYSKRSQAYRDIGRLREALEDALKAVAVDSTSPLYWTRLGFIYGTFKMQDSAGIALQYALKLNPRYYDAVCLYAIYHKVKQRYADALLWINKAIKIDAKDSYAYFTRGAIYADLEKYKEAIADIDYVLAKDSCYTELYFKKAYCYDMMNKDELALQWYSISVNKHARNIYAHYNRGLIYEKKNEGAKAAEDFVEAALLGYNKAVKRLEDRYPAYYAKYLEQRKK